MSAELMSTPLGMGDLQLFLSKLIEPLKQEISFLKAEIDELRKENIQQKDRIAVLEKMDIASIVQEKMKYVNIDEAVFTALSRYKNKPRLDSLIEERIEDSYLAEDIRAIKIKVGMFAQDAMDVSERSIISHDVRISHLEEKIKNQPLTSTSPKNPPKIQGGVAEIRADEIAKELLSCPEKNTVGEEYLSTKRINLILRKLTGKGKLGKGQNIAQAKKEALAIIEKFYTGIAYIKKVGQEVRVFKGSKA